MVDTAIPMLVFFLMFIIGAGLTTADFKRIQQQPKIIVSATIGQLVLLPLAAWLLIQLLQPSPAIAVGMLLISLCPGGAVSNFYSFLARANVALSVTLTALSSLLAALLLPFAVTAMFPDKLGEGVDNLAFAWRLSLQLLLLLLCPVVIGMLLRQRLTDFVVRHMPNLERLGALGLLLLLATIFMRHQQQISDNLSSLIVTAVVFSMVSIVVAWLVCRVLSLNSADSAAIMIEYPVRNLALAAMIAVNIFQDSAYLLFAAIFFVVQTPIIIGLMAFYRRGLSHAEQSAQAQPTP